MLNAIGFVVLILVGIAILGPEKLPVAVEAIALNVLNFTRSRQEDEPLSLEEAREHWKSEESLVYSIVQFLLAAQEHLVELRGRIFKSLIAIGICAVVAGVGSNYILEWLVKPSGTTLIALQPTEMFGTYIRVIITTAIGLSVPVLLYHTLAFIYPALETPDEKSIFRTVVFRPSVNRP